MRRLAIIFGSCLILVLASPGETLSAPVDSGIKIDKCKISKKDQGCNVVSAPEIGAAGGLIPVVLLGGILLLVAESRRGSH